MTSNRFADVGIEIGLDDDEVVFVIHFKADFQAGDTLRLRCPEEMPGDPLYAAKLGLMRAAFAKAKSELEEAVSAPSAGARRRRRR